MGWADYCRFRYSRYQAILHRRRGCDAKCMAIHAAFAEELAGLQNRDHGFLAMLGHDSELDLTFLKVKHSVGDIALLEHVLIFMEFQYLLSRAHLGEKAFGVKHVLGWLLHGSLLWLDHFIQL